MPPSAAAAPWAATSSARPARLKRAVVRDGMRSNDVVMAGSTRSNGVTYTSDVMPRRETENAMTRICLEFSIE